MDASTAAFSPRRGETNRTGISLGNSGSVYPRVYPSARATNFRFSDATAISDFGRRDFASAELRRSRRACFPFGAERERSHTRRRGTARAGPRESAAHARASAFALQEREALARLVKGCAWAGLDPADPRSVESRARRGCALGGLGACLSASLDRYRSAPTPHLARWRRASPTPRPWSGSRA